MCTASSYKAFSELSASFGKAFKVPYSSNLETQTQILLVLTVTGNKEFLKLLGCLLKALQKLVESLSKVLQMFAVHTALIQAEGYMNKAFRVGHCCLCWELSVQNSPNVLVPKV